jgi:RNA polymerase sigma factor (TIGR02999 family)
MLSTEAVAVADVTALLRELAGGRADSLPLLFAQVQGDLRRVAHRERLAAHAGETLSTTALINEAYLKLDHARLPPFTDRRHFYNIAARAMRQVLVDYARMKFSAKRGSGVAAQALDAVTDPGDDPAAAARLLEINDALDRLEAVRPRLAQVVYLRFYAGLSDREIGDLLNVEESTVRRDWLKARGWLFQALEPS